MEPKAKISDLRNKLIQSNEKQKECEHFISATLQNNYKADTRKGVSME